MILFALRMMSESGRRTLVEFVALKDVDSADAFGDRAFQLGRCARVGLPVPPGIVLAEDDVRMLVAGRARVRDFDALRAISSTPTTWAVRSSAVGGDSQHANLQHHNLLGVPEEQLQEAIFEVARSTVAIDAAVGGAASVDAAAGGAMAHLAVVNRLEGEGPPAASAAVLVQSMVAADISGVLLSRHPIDKSRVRFIEASYGLGDAMARGLATPDQYVVEPGGELQNSFIGEKELGRYLDVEGKIEARYTSAAEASQACLRPWHLEELDDLATRTEALLGSPVDLEWAFCGRRLFLLQMRSMTV